MDELDHLLEAANRGELREASAGGDGVSRPLRVIPPEPGEPPLLGQSVTTKQMNGFQRRIMQRQQATERRIQFARELVASGFDAPKALFAAGYNVSARAIGEAVRSLMNHPDVISEVNRLRAVLEQRADVAVIDLAKEWVQIASSNVFDYFDEAEAGHLSLKSKKEIPKAAQRSVKSLKIKRRRVTDKDGDVTETEDIELTLWDKQAALNSLAEIQGLYQKSSDASIDSLAQKIAERTEKHRKLVSGKTIEGTVVPKPE